MEVRQRQQAEPTHGNTAMAADLPMQVERTIQKIMQQVYCHQTPINSEEYIPQPVGLFVLIRAMW